MMSTASADTIAGCQRSIIWPDCPAQPTGWPLACPGLRWSTQVHCLTGRHAAITLYACFADQAMGLALYDLKPTCTREFTHSCLHNARCTQTSYNTIVKVHAVASFKPMLQFKIFQHAMFSAAGSIWTEHSDDHIILHIRGARSRFPGQLSGPSIRLVCPHMSAFH